MGGEEGRVAAELRDVDRTGQVEEVRSIGDDGLVVELGDERLDEVGGRITVVEAGVDAGGVRPAEDRHGVDRIGGDDRDAAHASVSQPGPDGSGQP